MEKIRHLVTTYGLVLGLAALVLSVVVAVAANNHDVQMLASSQNIAIGGLALILAGRP